VDGPLAGLPVSAVLTLEIGWRELRMLEADGRRVTRHAEVTLPEGALEDGMPTALVTTAIRSAVEANSFHAKAVRVAIGDQGIAIRDFRLPSLPASELARAVLFEGRRLVPMDPGDVYYAWHADRAPEGYRIYLVAARRDMIDGTTRALIAAGLRPVRIDLKPLALARGVAATDGLLLDWSPSEATLVLMVGGRPRFFRSFTLDAAADDVAGQLDELTLSLNALVKFVRGAEPDVSIGPETSLYLSGRFAFVDGGMEQARRRFEFAVTEPTRRFRAPADFPWQAHLAGLGLLQPVRWQDRLTPSQGGDARVAA
jgi:type IV pilus assembly PilM-like protein